MQSRCVMQCPNIFTIRGKEVLEPQGDVVDAASLLHVA